MKKYFSILLTLMLFPLGQTFAYDGIVIVLEAPLLREPLLDSTVLQVIRKGQRVYVPREIGDTQPLPEFIATFDRAGNRAYVPSRYIKVVTAKAAYEAQEPITLAGHDPTDYRIEEPISASYPFEDRNFMRASISLLVGNNANTLYSYNSAFNEQSYGAEIGARVSVTKKIVYDKFDRFYFGFIGFVTTAKNTIDFKNMNEAQENRTVFRAGPWITYDAFKNEKYRLNIGTGFTFNYHHSSLQMSSGVDEEKRIFSGFSISPMTSTAFQISNIIPNMDFISGVDLSLYLPYTLKNSNEPQYPGLWGETSQINNRLQAQASFFLGVQFKY